MGKRLLWLWNEEEKRVRAGWRVLLQMILTAGLTFTLASSGFFTGGNYLLARIEFSLMVVAIGVLLFMTRFIDKREIRDLGINILDKNWWSDFGFGIFLGLFQTIVFLVVALFLGWITIEPVFRALEGNLPLILALFLDIFTFICVAIMEELVRAYQVRNIAEGVANTSLNWRLGLLAGALIASLFSVTMHLNQQGPGFWIYVFVRSLLYCFCFCITGRVAIAMGLHFAWDFFTTTVVLLGGGDGISAVALYSAPLTATGNITQMVNQLNILGLLMQIPIFLLLLAWVYWRYGMIRLKKELTIYSFRESLLDKHATRIITDGILKDALK